MTVFLLYGRARGARRLRLAATGVRLARLLAALWLFAALATAVPTRPTAPVTSAAPGAAVASAAASPRQLQRARRYWYGGLFWGTLAQLWLFAVLLWMALPRRAARWRAALERQLRQRWLVVAAFAAWALAIAAVASLPFGVYLDYFRERSFGFERQTLGGWWRDWAKGFGVELIAVIIAAEIVYAILSRRRGPAPPRRAWPAAWQVWIPTVVLMVVAVAIQPVFIAPLFNRFTPLPAGRLRTELLAMAHRAGIPTSNIYVADTGRQSSHTNAYVVGLLGTQRIVIYDTLLAAETRPEVEFVVGHEIGHYVEHHIWRGIGFGAALLLLFLWIAFRLYQRWAPALGYRGLDDVAGLPLLALLLSGLFFIAAPLTNGYSRHLEHRADAYGLAIAPDPCAAVSSFEKDVRTDLIDPDPPGWVEWWFFNHPSDAQRIAFANQACRRAQGGIGRQRRAGR